jgi:hypothetical protein
MAELVVKATTNFGRLEGSDAVYADACASAYSSAANVFVGQLLSGGAYYVQSSYLEFDTSDIGDGTVTSVVLSLYNRENQNVGTSFTIQARPFDYGTSFTTADWRTPSQFSALTLLATLVVPTGYGDAQYYDFSSESAFKDNINKTGYTRLILASDRFASETAPTGVERQLYWYPTDTNKEPKLVITYTEAGNAKPHYYYAQL